MSGIQTKPEPWCPLCGARMVLHKPGPGKKTRRAFWGCSEWPDCEGTREIREDGTPEDDEGEFTPEDFGEGGW